ncbi:MAG: hypothetical protein GXZ05_01960 [Gammaproteobacteria bacterium]|nr:hypothetical protein [Gammaproteobacteria bacterium]
MIPLLPWAAYLAGGLAVYAGKKLYDVVTEDSSSSSYVDNSEELIREARAAEQRRAEEQRRKRQHNQLLQAIKGELRWLCHRFEIAQDVPFSISDIQLKHFSSFEITDTASASAALGQLLGKTVKLKEQPGQQAEYRHQLAALDELEQLVKKL